MINLLLLGTSPGSYLTDALDKRDDFTYSIIGTSGLWFSLHGGTETIYYNGKRVPIEEYNILFQSKALGNDRIGNKLKAFCRDNGLIVFPDSDTVRRTSDKYLCYRIFQKEGIRIPKTILVKSVSPSFEMINEQCKIFDSWPLLVKPNDGSLGRGVTAVSSSDSLLAAIQRSKEGLLIQEYISPYLRIDERHMVIGDRVVSSMRRFAAANQVATNFNAQGDREPIVCDKETEDICVKACKAVGLEYAGVDIIRDEEGKPYLLEVNCYPFDAIINVTGYNYFNDLLDYFKTLK